LSEDQVADAVTFSVVPFESVAVAVNWLVWFLFTSAALPVIARPDTVGDGLRATFCCSHSRHTRPILGD